MPELSPKSENLTHWLIASKHKSPLTEDLSLKLLINFGWYKNNVWWFDLESNRQFPNLLFTIQGGIISQSFGQVSGGDYFAIFCSGFRGDRGESFTGAATATIIFGCHSSKVVFYLSISQSSFWSFILQTNSDLSGSHQKSRLYLIIKRSFLWKNKEWIFQPLRQD